MPRKGQRMTTEQRQKIRASIVARKAAASKPEPPPETLTETTGGIEAVVVNPESQKAPVSLLDRIKGNLKGDSNAASQPAQGGVEEESFIFALVPVASGFLAYRAADLWGEDYRKCAPSKGEVSAILTPLARILSRRLEINLKETPDIRDLRIGGTALLIYVIRAATTSMEISASLEGERAVNEAERHIKRGQGSQGTLRPQESTLSNARESRTGENQGAGSGTGGYSAGFDGPGPGRGIYSQPATASGGNPETDAEYARRIIADAYRQDREYRSQHGLL